jgi:hypothetical protein
MDMTENRHQTNRAGTAGAIERRRAGKTGRGWYTSGAVTAGEIEFRGTRSLLRYGDAPQRWRARKRTVSAMRGGPEQLSHAGAPRADVGTRRKFADGMQRRASPAG